MGPTKEKGSQIYAKSWPGVLGQIDELIEIVSTKRYKFYGRFISKQLFINSIFLGIRKLAEENESLLMEIYDEGSKQYESFLADGRRPKRKTAGAGNGEKEGEDQARPKLRRKIKIPLTDPLLESIRLADNVERPHRDNQGAVGK